MTYVESSRSYTVIFFRNRFYHTATEMGPKKCYRDYQGIKLYTDFILYIGMARCQIWNNHYFCSLAKMHWHWMSLAYFWWTEVLELNSGKVNPQSIKRHGRQGLHTRFDTGSCWSTPWVNEGPEEAGDELGGPPISVAHPSQLHPVTVMWEHTRMVVSFSWKKKAWDFLFYFKFWQGIEKCKILWEP